MWTAHNTGHALVRQGPRLVCPEATPVDKIANPMLPTRRYSVNSGGFTPLAFGCCGAHTASHEYSLRSNRLFGRCEEPGAASETVEMGDLSGWSNEPDRMFIGPL
jgi:hypothetical protein